MFLISHLLVRDVLDVTTKEEDVVHQRIPAMRVRVIVMGQEMEEEMMDTWDAKMTRMSFRIYFLETFLSSICMHSIC